MELKPCPFCGGKARFIEIPEQGRVFESYLYDIGCKTEGCFLESGADWVVEKEFVAKMWNERAEVEKCHP